MATTYDQKHQVETDDENDNNDLHKFLYEDKSIEDLSTERDENWNETYHVLLGKLDDDKGDWEWF